MLTHLSSHINEMADSVHGLRSLSRMTGLSVSYLSRMAAGHANNPSDETLHRLCLRRVTQYEVISGTLGQSLNQPINEEQ